MVTLVINNLHFLFSGKRRRKLTLSSSSTSSRISTNEMQNIVERLMAKQNRDSTIKMYLSVWRQFNQFVISLDRIPKLWEDRATLFIGYLVDKGIQSATIRSYISAIKKTLVVDGYKWNDDLVLVRSLAKACRIINDRVQTRFPIHYGLLEMILFELERIFDQQWYLEILYKTLFAISYYGLMRVSETTSSPHVLKAKDVHIATNKDKLLLILYSSKTHDKGNRLQKIKITSNKEEKSGNYIKHNFCLFHLMRQYIKIRGAYLQDNEQFFVFGDRSPVSANNPRRVLQQAFTALNLDHTLYGIHRFRIGRTTDLIKYKYSIDQVKLMGRWRSNVIFKYIR